jgi:uncharacterized membrane protein YkvA (DUF1232 family)
MGEQPGLMPTGISRQQFGALADYAATANAIDAQELLRRVGRHLDETRVAHARNRIVNLRLATVIAEVVTSLLSRWDFLPDQHRHWLGGAILYFVDSRDNEHDFSSAIGFEDDAEVLNSCLRFNGLDSLCIVIEDFDNA